jgi:GntR family transcriptional regulator/MocR family aminotransferase
MARQFANGKSIIDGQCNVVTQAIVSDFITQGHFSRHIRRMKLLYKRNQDELVTLIKRHLNGELVPVPVEAGMHFVAWLRENIDAEVIAHEALEKNLIVHPISQYCISAKHRNGLVLGFAGFSIKEMETAVLILKSVLDNHK